MTDRRRADRLAGAVVGWAVGDALGAPFEFGPVGMFSGRFPQPGGVDGNEMCGGGGWGPGEATDDTQMGLLVAESLLECGGLDLPDLFGRFHRWAAADPKDIGILTETVLTSGLLWDRAAEDYYAHNHLAAGNGSLMRALPAALYYARTDRPTRADAARRISALTHADPATGWGCVIHQELVIATLDGTGIDAALPDALALVEAWARSEEFHGTADAELLYDFLERMAALAGVSSYFYTPAICCPGSCQESGRAADPRMPALFAYYSVTQLSPVRRRIATTAGQGLWLGRPRLAGASHPTLTPDP